MLRPRSVVARLGVILNAFRGRIRMIHACDCRHYCGFRYGSGSVNLYENYMVGLHEGISTNELENRFIDGLRWYRPRSMAQVLEVEFENVIPLWCFPWSRRYAVHAGWVKEPVDVPDILTHFTESGIPLSRIREEISWLQLAYRSVGQRGYQPGLFRHVQVVEVNTRINRFYLVVDGNHRTSAMVAQGIDRFPARVVARVDFSHVDQMPQVRSGVYSMTEAMLLYDRYLAGVVRLYRSCQPAEVIVDV